MERLAPGVVTLLAVAACTATSPIASASPSPSRSPAASSSAATTASPAATSSATATASASAAGLACKLPLAAGGAPMSGPSGGGTTGHGGFVTFPGGAFAVDPASAGAFDRQASRWVPASYLAVSPDGARYAYSVIPQVAGPGTGAVHIVTVATGADAVAQTPGPVAVIAWTGTGVYVESVIPQSDAPPQGLILIDPDALTFHQITASGFWQAVGDHSAYITDIDPNDPHPPQQTGPGPVPGDRVERMDISTGAITPVVTVNGARVEILGLDSSQNPIVSADNATTYTVELTPSNQQIFTGSPIESPSGAGDPLTALADSTGIWFSSISGEIWHYGPGDSTLQALSNTGLNFPLLAGPCV